MKTIYILLISLIQLASSQQSDNEEIDANDVYDFVIIGAGASGSVIANRLSEIESWRVLLIEAGGKPTILNEIPVISVILQFTGNNWGYKAEKQDGFCKGCSGGSLMWPHGKVLGGSTNINYMVYARGNKLDYDRWAAMGNPGWSYEDVLPYFKKSEDAHIKIQDEEYHHVGGYLTVTDIPFRTKSADVFVQAVQEVGLPYVDYNGKNQLGVSYLQGTLRNGRRCSAEKALLRPARDRKNLRILTKATVVKILIHEDTKEAYGVEYQRKGKYHTAVAKKEVILCAGSLNSPQLLMLSGIGPKQHLEELGIPLIKDLPVGQKMYDHPTFAAVSIIVNDTSIVFNALKSILNPITYLQYILNGRGPLSFMSGTEAVAFIKTNASTDPEPSYPDIELIFAGASANIDYGLFFRRIFNIPTETYNKVWKPYENKGVVQVFPVVVHPKSYGYIKLKSKNPFDAPKFYANYFSDPENHDVKTLIASVRVIQRIIQSPSMQKYKAKLIPTPIPGCEQHNFDSDDYWECAIRTVTGTFYHQMTTCKMGPSNDSEAVVDANLRVYGINNLRVADASIIPRPLAAHMSAPTYMVGEKVSDLIKEYWGEKQEV